MITLEKLHAALVNDQFQVMVPEEVAAKARLSIERMVAIG